MLNNFPLTIRITIFALRKNKLHNFFNKCFDVICWETSDVFFCSNETHLQVSFSENHLYVKHGHSKMEHKPSILRILEIRVIIQIIQVFICKRYTVIPTILHGKASILLRQIQLYLIRILNLILKK